MCFGLFWMCCRVPPPVTQIILMKVQKLLAVGGRMIYWGWHRLPPLIMPKKSINRKISSVVQLSYCILHDFHLASEIHQECKINNILYLILGVPLFWAECVNVSHAPNAFITESDIMLDDILKTISKRKNVPYCPQLWKRDDHSIIWISTTESEQRYYVGDGCYSRACH